MSITAAWGQVACPTCPAVAGMYCMSVRSIRDGGWRLPTGDWLPQAKFITHVHAARIAAGKAAQPQRSRRGGAHNHNGSRKRR